MDGDFATYSLEVLLQEPERLENSIASLKHQFDESMTANYDFFLTTCEHASTITEDLERCTATVSALSGALSRAAGQCGDLCLLGQSAVAANARVSAAFHRLPQLTEILEAPRTMEGLAVQGRCEEALQLFGAVEGLARQYAGVPALQRTLGAARARRAEVAERLLRGFDRAARAGETARALSLLRGAGLHTEAQLQIALVCGKRGKLRAKAARAAGGAAADRAVALTGAVRRALFKIPTVYQGMFHDQDGLVLNVAVQRELAEYCAAVGALLDAVPDADGARRVVGEALEFVRAMAAVGFNFVALVDDVFYRSKWARAP
jgi:hypothetical protein